MNIKANILVDTEYKFSKYEIIKNFEKKNTIKYVSTILIYFIVYKNS